MSTLDLIDPIAETPTPPAPRRSRWWHRPGVVSAVVAVAAFAVVVLTHATSMLEPDDFAYRASIVALSHGQILLSNAQYLALEHSLASSGQSGVMQWHHMASGYWISEKNPGYPFLAVLFYLVGLLRLTPLFFGALACWGMFVGMRRWAGELAGVLVVWLYCFSGAALTFAWRATMPSFTDASLIAAGAGWLLWAMLATDATRSRRRWVGLAGLVALELAVFVRYTNILELAVAVLAVALGVRRARLGLATLVTWGSSLLALGVLVLGFDQWAYGSATSTGYSAGEITFSPSSFVPNLRHMPAQLTSAMPLWILAAASLAVIAWRALPRAHATVESTAARRDARVAAVLAAGWLGLWILYLCYTWTVNMSSGGSGATVHVIRFYLPALGPIAMLAAWLVARWRRPVAIATVALLVGASLVSFSSMTTSGGPGGGAPGGPGGIGGFGGHGPQPSGTSGARGPGGLGGRPPTGSFPGTSGSNGSTLSPQGIPSAAK